MEWFNKLTTASKVMIVGSLVLALAVSILIPVAVLTHTEPGLLTACETPTGALNYEGECFEVEWDPAQFPLDVAVTTSNEFPPADPTEATAGAIALINSRLGFTALRLTTEAGAEIRIDYETAQEVGSLAMRHSGGGALHTRRGGTMSCSIATWNNGTSEMVDKVLVHELGHCLGLADDDFPDSAMFTTLRPSGDRLTRPRITDFDRSLLRERYSDR